MWVYLILAIIAETVGTVSMKLSEGFTRLVPSVSVGLFYLISISLLVLTLKRVDIGVAYAIWSEMGTAPIATVGILWFEEPVTALKLASLSPIIAGVVGLNLGGAH